MLTMLDPSLTMRKDENRVVVYPGKEQVMKKTHEFAFRFVDPRAAIVISLFDGNRNEDDVSTIWSQLNDCDETAAKVAVKKVLNDHKDLMIESETIPSGFQSMNPEDLVCHMPDLNYSINRLNVPFSMLYVPTMHCAHNCRYCYADIKKTPSPDELTLEEFERILDQAVELQFADVTFSGGDPFLREDIFELMDMVFSRGFTSDVPTKSPLSRKQIERLNDIGVDRIQISLDSPFDEEMVEFLTGRPNYYKKIMETLAMCGEAGLKVGITCVVTSQTIDSVPRMAEWYADLGFVTRVSFAQLGASIYRDFPELYPPTEKYDWLAKELDPFKKRYDHIFIKWDSLQDPKCMTDEERTEWFENRPTCSGGKWAFILLPDGKATLCEELYHHPAFIVGDLKKQSILEMWKSPEMLNVIEPEQEKFVGSPCFECDTFYECHTGRGRCWKRAMGAYKTEKNPEFWPDPFCPRAPQTHRRLF